MDNFKVLLVDNQPVIITLIKLCLYESGVKSVVEASDHSQAIKLLNDDKFDLVISSLNIPHMTGLNILNYIKSNSNLSSIPLVMMTSARQLAEVPELKNKDVAGYIMKPFTRESVMGVVESVVGDASAIRM
jgi:two-component system chemotaxis response regulator CheY